MRENDKSYNVSDRRNYNLDLLRIMVCIAVIGLHTSSKDVSVLNTLIYYFCGFAVPLFFMAIGYILMQRTEITKNYVRKNITKVNLSQKAKKYVSMFTPFVMGIYIVHPLILWIINHFWRVEVPIYALYLFLGVLFVTLNAVVFMNKIPYLNKLIKL